jgi:hypothetical protein
MDLRTVQIPGMEIHDLDRVLCKCHHGELSMSVDADSRGKQLQKLLSEIVRTELRKITGCECPSPKSVPTTIEAGNSNSSGALSKNSQITSRRQKSTRSTEKADEYTKGCYQDMKILRQETRQVRRNDEASNHSIEEPVTVEPNDGYDRTLLNVGSENSPKNRSSAAEPENSDEAGEKPPQTQQARSRRLDVRRCRKPAERRPPYKCYSSGQCW